MTLEVMELRRQRANLVHEARNLLEAAEGENRDLSAEEQTQWDRMMGDAGTLGTRIQRAEQIRSLSADLGDVEQRGTRPDPEDGQGRGDELTQEFFSRGMRLVGESRSDWQSDQEWQRLVRASRSEPRQAMTQYLRFGRDVMPPHQVRNLQADSQPKGGYLLTPLQFVDMLIKNVDDMVFLRQWATVLTLGSAESLGAPTLESDPADADWTSELKTGQEDDNMEFGRRELHPHPLAKRIRISRKLLMKLPNVESFAAQRFGYKFAITWEKAGMLGTGANQPLGVFVASNQGISTARDVVGGNTATSITFDGLITSKYALKGQYWPRARWLFHRDSLAQIAKLKDLEDRYLWRESVRAGEPDRLLNLPVFMSEYAPNTFTANQYVGMLADFSWYWIADSMSFDIQRLDELYAESNQVGMIGRLESDGQPVLEEAFVRVQLGS
ncbi:MAG: phage major capsid protein [Chloroflexota bacterium]